MNPRYLSRSEFAQRIGVKVGTLSRYDLPEPDVIIGSGPRPTFGWSKETIDCWQQQRPRANRETDKRTP